MSKQRIWNYRCYAGWVLAMAACAWGGLMDRSALGAEASGRTGKPLPEQKVDFAYSFGLPHRMTVALPDSSDKTLIDVFSDKLQVRWTYGNLRNVPLAAFMPLNCNWVADLWPEIDGKRLVQPKYTRAEGFLPVLQASYSNPLGGVEVELVGGATAAITQVKVANRSAAPHRFSVAFSMNGPFGEVPGYINTGESLDYLLAGWCDRADRVLALGVGASTPLRKDTPAKTIALEWELKPGETGVGWLVRPYQAYETDVPRLRAHDWAREFEQGKAVWRELLGRAMRVEIPDAGVRNAYYASIGDIFIMREPVADGYIACSPGTEGYRCPNSGEACVAAVGLDQAGLHRESALGFQMHLDQQGENGDWSDPRGWTHRWWSASGLKAWAALEHYKLTGDRSYLKKVYPRLLSCSRWQERQRQRTRVEVKGQRPLYYGLMPRGQGDCGLDGGDGWYGYFFPHNIWAVYADKLAIEAAKILRKNDEATELAGNYDRAHGDLLTALDRGAIKAEGYRWLPGSPSNPAGSRWGVLNAAFPCEVLPAGHELITGTLTYVNQHLSTGGLQLHTGWMADGMWVAISLDNVAEVELARNNGDEAARLLYACLNHATPLYTWCEERGQEAGSSNISGDRQHLWTPAAVVRVVRDCLVMEEADGLHLARGAARSWLGGGQAFGVEQAPTHFGPVSYRMKYDAGTGHVTGTATFSRKASAHWVVLHTRLPGVTLKSVDVKSGATVLPDGEGIKWLNPSGEVSFVAETR